MWYRDHIVLFFNIHVPLVLVQLNVMTTDDIRDNGMITRVTNLVTDDNSFKVPPTIINYTYMVLTRQEKEKLVLDLYNQGKTYREIAKEARMCPRDIGVIVNKAVREQELKTDHRNDKENQDTNNSAEKELKDQELSLSTRAYKLFSKGKALVEVAVALNLGEAEVTRYYKEYLKLKQSHGLYSAYEEIEGEIEPFLKLYELSKAADMDTKQVVNLLEIANNDLPALENRYHE